MAVRIRMKKMGRRHRPYYRIAVMDQRTPRNGRSIEDVGTYDPMIREADKRCTMNAERIDYWMSVGALPTEKVAALIKKYKGKVPAVRRDDKYQYAIPEAAPLLADPRHDPAAAAAAAAAESEAAAEASEAEATEGEAAPAEAEAPAEG